MGHGAHWLVRRQAPGRGADRGRDRSRSSERDGRGDHLPPPLRARRARRRPSAAHGRRLGSRLRARRVLVPAATAHELPGQGAGARPAASASRTGAPARSVEVMRRGHLGRDGPRGEVGALAKSTRQRRRQVDPGRVRLRSPTSRPRRRHHREEARAGAARQRPALRPPAGAPQRLPVLDRRRRQRTRDGALPARRRSTASRPRR